MAMPLNYHDLGPPRPVPRQLFLARYPLNPKIRQVQQEGFSEEGTALPDWWMSKEPLTF